MSCYKNASNTVKKPWKHNEFPDSVFPVKENSASAFFWHFLGTKILLANKFFWNFAIKLLNFQLPLHETRVPNYVKTTIISIQTILKLRQNIRIKTNYSTLNLTCLCGEFLFSCFFPGYEISGFRQFICNIIGFF